MNDFRYALRRLAKSPAFTLAAVVTLALGIGANSAIFSMLNELLFRPLPVRKPDELMAMVLLNRAGENSGQVIPYPIYRDYAEHAKVFSDLIADARVFTRVPWGDRRQVILAEVVSGNFFDALGVKPILGRGFIEEENLVPMRDAVVVISYEFWRKRFDLDPQVIGRQVGLDDFIDGPRSFTIVGVAPA